MTERLYYENSFLFNFSAKLREVRTLADGRCALVLDATAFYPGGGGQPCDTGWIEFLDTEDGGSAASRDLPKLRVAEVRADDAAGEIVHVLDPLREGASARLSERLAAPGPVPLRVRGFLDAERRQDHMQQHSGQHLLSAAFRKSCGAATLGSHLGEELSSIELGIAALSAAQIEQAERLANQFVWEDRQVLMHEVSAAQARKLGLPAAGEAAGPSLRLVEFRGVDLSLCGGTHVNTTGQIGNIQIRGCGATVQGSCVEFVCGARALRMARADFEATSRASQPGRAPSRRAPEDAPSAAGKPPR